MIRRLTILLFIVGCEMPTQTNNDDEYLGSYRFGIPVASHVNIKVHDILGNEVAILVDEFLEAGWHDFSLPLILSLRSKPSGMYYVYFSNGDTVVTRLITRIK